MGLLVRNAVDGMGQTLVFFPAFVMSVTGMAQQKGRKSHHPEKKGTSGMPPVHPAVGAGMGSCPGAESMWERLRRQEKAAGRGGNTSRVQVLHG